jgi:hypothetical protein
MAASLRGDDDAGQETGYHARASPITASDGTFQLSDAIFDCTATRVNSAETSVVESLQKSIGCGLARLAGGRCALRGRSRAGARIHSG